MAIPKPGPLTDEHCACLDRVIARTQPLIDLARQCQECGWDVQQAIEALNEQLTMAQKAKASFFPHKS